MSTIQVIFLVLSLILNVFVFNSEAYRILIVYPTASFSHQRTQMAISKGLAAAGHELVIVATDSFETTNPNVTFLDMGGLYKPAGGLIKDMAKDQMPLDDLFVLWLQVIESTVDFIMQHDQVRDLLADDKQYFDAVIVENFGFSTFNALAVKYDAALIGVSSLETGPNIHTVIGNPVHPVLHPGVAAPIPENPSLFKRWKMLYDYLDNDYWFKTAYNNKQFELWKKYLPTYGMTPDDLIDITEIHIEAVSPVMGHTRPLLPNTKQIGFLHIEPPQPLPADLQKYLDSANNGFVYVSFGSNVQSATIRPELMKTLKSVIGSLPYHVLWKYEAETMPEKPDNVRIIKWAPQLDILAHKNIKLFITQGGQQSLDEGIARGVPLLVIPFFGDQEYNADKVEKLRVGRKIFTKDLTEERFRHGINEVINNSQYKNKAVQLRELVFDTPMPPVETAVWWIEYAIRNKGAKHLKYNGRLMPFYQYYFLDVLGAHLVALFVLSYVLKKLWVAFISLFKAKNDGKLKRS